MTMNVFKIVFKIVFLMQIILWTIAAFTYIFSYQTFSYFDFLAVNTMLFLQIPVFIVFLFVVLYNCLFKKKSFIFFKTEYMYVLILISVLLVLTLFYYICPNCKK